MLVNVIAFGVVGIFLLVGFYIASMTAADDLETGFLGGAIAVIMGCGFIVALVWAIVHVLLTLKAIA